MRVSLCARTETRQKQLFVAEGKDSSFLPSTNRQKFLSVCLGRAGHLLDGEDSHTCALLPSRPSRARFSAAYSMVDRPRSWSPSRYISLLVTVTRHSSEMWLLMFIRNRLMKNARKWVFATSCCFRPRQTWRWFHGRPPPFFRTRVTGS